MIIVLTGDASTILASLPKNARVVKRGLVWRLDNGDPEREGFSGEIEFVEAIRIATAPSGDPVFISHRATRRALQFLDSLDATRMGVIIPRTHPRAISRAQLDWLIDNALPRVQKLEGQADVLIPSMELRTADSIEYMRVPHVMSGSTPWIEVA